MRIERIWAMPNLYTFTIHPIKKLIEEEKTQGMWIDPFSGKNSPAMVTNDICIDLPATHHLDALAFLRLFPSASVDGVFYDPPYSITQARNYGKKEFGNMRYWADCKDEVARVLRPGGKCLCFGWTSQGIGKSRGFVLERVLLVPHGGSKNDTICTVETKKL